MIETIQWTDAGVVMIDQTRLPRQEIYVTCTNYREVAEAIRSMVIRGAPAIGVAAAMGIALGMQQAKSAAELDEICEAIRATRPTAVNLFWAIERMRRVFHEVAGRDLAAIRATADRRSHPDSPGRHRHQRMHREERRAADSRRQNRPHALQRGRAGDRRLWYGAWA